MLSQSGLYSTVILLAMIRGACLDVFSCLVGASEQVLGICFHLIFLKKHISHCSHDF